MMGTVTKEDVATEPVERSVAQTRQFSNEPLVRVCLIQNEPQFDFRVDGRFSVLNMENDVIFDRIQSRRRWRIRVDESHSSKCDYGCLLRHFSKFELAEAYQREMADTGIDTQIVKVGDLLTLESWKDIDNTSYAVIFGWWDNEEDAGLAYKAAQLPCIPLIFRQRRGKPRGKIEIFDLDFERSVILEKGVTLTLSGAQACFSILDLKSSNQNGRTSRSNRDCRGELDVQINEFGNLTVILNIPLEAYLTSLTTPELDPLLPAEALKAHAVALRGLCLRMMGRAHLGESYDFCIDSHCREFTGIREMPAVLTKVLKDTAGEVLVWNDQVCESVSTRNCGGITEADVTASDGRERPYLQSVLDSPKRAPAGYALGVIQRDLVGKWIGKPSNSFCFLEERTSKSEMIAFGRRHRWEIRISRREIESSLQKNLKIDVGTLYDIIPVKWGTSGRIACVELIGSQSNTQLFGRNLISTGLVEGGLPSACFTVEPLIGNDGEPVEFLFRGAGEGPGVGLCQAGAVGMALDGIKYAKILKHYFPETTLTRLY